MSEPIATFDWIIDERKSWPPRTRPSAPYGSSLLEVMRECPLRACFERSTGYERRMGFAARIGTAFHQTLQYLNEHPAIGKPVAQIMEHAREHFYFELDKQISEQAKRPRERSLLRDETRIERALDAVITEALRISEDGTFAQGGWHTERGDARTNSQVNTHDAIEAGSAQIEVLVESKDQIFHGRVDRAERTPEGAILFDYKSALRDDLPERYERQLQLYAWLWHETFELWPIDAHVIYPFKGTTYTVAIDQETCLRVVAEYRQVINDMKHELMAERLAKPGAVCQVCEFRPWCQAFWKWQSTEIKLKPALERARYGFEGEVIEKKDVDHHWMIRVLWRHMKIKLVAPQERFPQLHDAKVGTHIRVLDMELGGQMIEPQARVTPASEVFILRSD